MLVANINIYMEKPLKHQRRLGLVCKVMTQVTGQQALPHTQSPQSFNRYNTDSILNDA